MIWGLPSRRRRQVARAFRAAQRVCRRTPPDGEWGFYEARWFGYRLKFLGPCREFHLDEPDPHGPDIIDCGADDMIEDDEEDLVDDLDDDEDGGH